MGDYTPEELNLSKTEKTIETTHHTASWDVVRRLLRRNAVY